MALLLCFVIIGGLIFLYMLIVKPDGTLTVTYALRETARAVPVSAVPSRSTSTAPRSLASRLAQLDEAHQAGLITDEEYQARRKEMIAGV